MATPAGVKVGATFSLTKTEQLALGPLLQQQAQVQAAINEVGNELQKRLGLPEGTNVEIQGDKVVVKGLPAETPQKTAKDAAKPK